MTTQSWHADDMLLAAYVAGRLDAVAGTSVEQHVTHCADCRAAVAPMADLPAIDRAWEGVRTRIESPSQPLLIRAARRAGLPEPTAVLLAATASLRTSWLVGALVTLGFALVASLVTGGGVLWPFLLVAPLVPVLGVAVAYGPAEDPFEALAVTAPYSRTRLILVRTLAVLTSSLPAAALLGVLLPGPAWLAVAWLGPALGLIPVQLAIASFVDPRLAGGLIAIGWAGVVLSSVRHHAPTWPVEAEQQLVVLSLAVAACAVLALRSMRANRVGVPL
jgi:Putative zinc-finger